MLVLTVSGVFRAKKEERIIEILETAATDSGLSFEELRKAYDAEKELRAAKAVRKLEAKFNKPVSGGTVEALNSVIEHDGSVIITACQNNTDIHTEFWSALQNYADFIGAKIIVAPMLYNKNAWAQPDSIDADIWFDPRIKPFIQSEAVYVHGVKVLCNAHVMPTAKNPLNGFEGATGAGVSICVPASVISMKTIARLKGESLKVMYSTGCVSQLNYVQRKAGTVAELNHSFGAVIIESDGRMRSIEWMQGGSEFFDYSPSLGLITSSASKSVSDGGAVSVTLGDIHAEKCSNERLETMQDFVNSINPKHVILHDVCDFSSRNHHNRKSPLFIFANNQRGESVANDVARVINVLESFDGYKVHVIDSNHDRALDRWLDEADYRDDSINALTFLSLQTKRYCATRDGDKWHALESACVYVNEHSFSFQEKNMEDYVTFHAADTLVSDGVTGVNYGHHGDRGPNGARGSIQSFRGLGQSLIIGHSHSPGIAGKVYQVGVGGDLDMGYNVGPSSWAHAHCITFRNGQRQMYFEQDQSV